MMERYDCEVRVTIVGTHDEQEAAGRRLCFGRDDVLR